MYWVCVGPDKNCKTIQIFNIFCMQIRNENADISNIFLETDNAIIVESNKGN